MVIGIFVLPWNKIISILCSAVSTRLIWRLVFIREMSDYFIVIEIIRYLVQRFNSSLIRRITAERWICRYLQHTIFVIEQSLYLHIDTFATNIIMYFQRATLPANRNKNNNMPISVENSKEDYSINSMRKLPFGIIIRWSRSNLDKLGNVYRKE